ncbi:MAG TPA: ParA family protein [Natronosporangium sp.]|nr:ParA family protein [Natronosporangium sp.]
MSLTALVSAKGSPGVTVAALACTLTWPGRCVLVECDPAGGSVQAGFLAGALPADRGIGELAVAHLRGESLSDVWWRQLIDLRPPHAQRLLLPGITDPVRSATLQPVWQHLAEFFSGLASDGYEVIADCGRLATPNPPLPVLHAADLVLLTLRPDLPGISAALPVARSLRAHLSGQRGGDPPLALLLTGPGDQPTRTVARHLDAPVAGTLPDDRRTAGVLSHGGAVRTGAPLMRAAADLHRGVARLSACDSVSSRGPQFARQAAPTAQAASAAEAAPTAQAASAAQTAPTAEAARFARTPATPADSPTASDPIGVSDGD